MKKTLLKMATVLLTALFITSFQTESVHAKSSDLCAKSGCNSKKYCGSYCAAHDSCKIKSACKTANYGGRKICKQSGCGNTASSDGYCGRHGNSSSSYKSTGKTYSKSSSSYKKSSSSKKSYSMPDPDDYEDFDDFMDDWDGCMPDGSDAEDYYDNW